MNYATDPSRIERNWRAITVELDAPRASSLERLLRRLGIPARITTLVVATPALRRAWFIALGLAILIGLAATDAAKPRDDLFVLLLLAPLVPTFGVGLAYGPTADPAYEVTLATPLSGLRLVLTRALAVVGCSTVALGLAALLTPSTPAMAFAWLLPSLGLSSATLAAMTYTSTRRATTIVGSVWLLVVLTIRAGSEDPLAAFTAVGQVTMVALTGLGLALAFLRRDRFDLLVAR